MLQAAPVDIEEALVPALVLEELEDDSFTSSFRSLRGRWQAASIFSRRPPFAKAISVFSKCGTGADEYVRAMTQAQHTQVS
jgi:hypothetical protein